MPTKSKILVIQKNGIYVAKLHTNTYQISKQYLYIWLCNGPKTGKVDDVTSEMQFFTFLIAMRKNK